MKVATETADGVILAPDDVGSTFVDPVRDRDLRTNGYTTFPVLDEGEVELIAAAHADLVGGGGTGMAVDYMREDRSVIARFNDLLTSVWERHFASIFVDHRPVFATCVVKHPGPDSAMFLHEDRSYVDERVARAGTLWIPLVDTGPGIDNGCLHVVPGSHRLAVAFSGSHTPDLFRPYEAALERALVPVEVPAGHGLFYDTRTLHASPPNRTATARPAIACAVAPRREPLIHVVGAGARERRVHRVDEAFFIDHGPEEIERSMPDRYRVVETFDDPVDHLEPEFVRSVCHLPETPTPEELIPGDLEDRFRGVRAAPATDTPQRTGALVATGVPRRPPGPPHSDPATVLPDEGWVPAWLWPGPEIGWWVGDPQLRMLPGERLGVRLASRERLVLRPGRTDLTLRPLDAPTFAAGIVTEGRADHLARGDALMISAGEDVVVWNHGPGDVVAVVQVGRSPGRWRERLRRGLTERAVRRVEHEVGAAVH